jgi:hypothetical protein
MGENIQTRRVRKQLDHSIHFHGRESFEPHQGLQKDRCAEKQNRMAKEFLR